MELLEIAVKLKDKYKSTGKVLQLIYDSALEQIEIPSVRNFIEYYQKEYSETEGEDCIIINGRLFDWKELESNEVIVEFLNLMRRYMSDEILCDILRKV